MTVFETHVLGFSSKSVISIRRCIQNDPTYFMLQQFLILYVFGTDKNVLYYEIYSFIKYN